MADQIENENHDTVNENQTRNWFWVWSSLWLRHTFERTAKLFKTKILDETCDNIIVCKNFKLEIRDSSFLQFWHLAWL